MEMELELITAEEAETKPAGSGREEPNANPTLDPPKSVLFTPVAKTVCCLVSCFCVLCDVICPCVQVCLTMQFYFQPCS